jgi:hypothetical protein
MRVLEPVHITHKTSQSSSSSCQPTYSTVYAAETQDTEARVRGSFQEYSGSGIHSNQRIK